MYFSVTKLHTSLKCIKIFLFPFYGAFLRIFRIMMSVILQR